MDNRDQKSSLILRTNPILTGNVKLVCDSNDKLYIEPIQVNDTLSNFVTYSRNVNPNSSYQEDLYSIFSKLPNTIFYEIGKKSDDRIYNDLSDQFEDTYSYGTKRCTSKLYEEQFKIFAPLLLGEKLPKYFCIFKVDGAKTHKKLKSFEEDELIIGVNYKLYGTSEESTIYHNGEQYKVGDEFVAKQKNFVKTDKNDLNIVWCIVKDGKYESSFDYFKDFISPSNLVKVIGIEGSNFEKYAKSLMSEKLFSKSPIEINYQQKKITYTGISVNKGGIISVEESIENLMKNELPIKLFDKHITEGFYRNNLVLSNLLNVEFLFDDKISEDFTTNRYYGFYTDDIDFYKFTQEEFVNFYDNYSSVLKNNESYFYIKNINDEIRKLNNHDIKNSEISNKNDLGYTFYDKLEVDKLKSRPTSSVLITLDKKIQIGNEIRVYLGDVYIETIIADTLAQFTEKDMAYKEWSQNGHMFNFFNPEGSDEQVLIRLGKTLVYLLGLIQDYAYKFAVYDNRLYVYSNSFAEPKLQLQLNEQKNNGELSISQNGELKGFANSNDYRFKIKAIDRSLYEGGNVYIKTINNTYAKVKDVSYFLDDMILENDIIINKDKIENYCTVTVDESLQSGIKFDDTDFIEIYTKKDIKLGAFDICNVCDFDFDFYSESYSSSYEGEYNKYYNVKSGSLIEGNYYYIYCPKSEAKVSISHNGAIYESKVNQNYLTPLQLRDKQDEDITFYKEKAKSEIYNFNGNYFFASSKDFEILEGNPIIINKKYLYDEELSIFPGFNCLKEKQNNKSNQNRDKSISEIIIEKYSSFPKKSINEYEILKENTNSDFAYLSKTVPFINKWVMKEKDVRGNNYRLNLSTSFGRNSFSPSFDIKYADPYNFTSEWFYISSYPEALSKDEIYNSTSYFDKLFDSELYATSSYDYFVDYFTVNDCTIIDQFGIVRVYPVKYQKRYSLLKKGSKEDSYSTFFRGVQIDFNSPNVNLEGYKFSVILNVKKTNFMTYDNPYEIEFNRNDKFKNIVLIINIYLDDYKILDVNGNIRCGYLYLYIMNSLQSYNSSQEYGASKEILDRKRFGIALRMKEYKNQQIINRYKNLNEEEFNSSIVFASKLFFRVGQNYEIESENNTILQFNDNIYKFMNWYRLNKDGSYKNLIGLRDNYVITTCPIEYDFTNRKVFMEVNRTNIINHDKRGLEMSEIDIKSDNNKKTFKGGISLVSSSNFSPISAYRFEKLMKIVNLTDMHWIELNGGFDYYKTLSGLLTFSSISDMVNEKSPLVIYYKIDNGSRKVDTKFGSVLIIKPSEIKLSSTLSYMEANVIDETYPNEILIDNKILDNKLSGEIINRYSGSFYPKLTNVIDFSDIARKLEWYEENSRWHNNRKKWQKRYENGEEYTEDISKFESGSDINESNINKSELFYEKNMEILSEPTIKNHFFHKISKSGDSIINTLKSSYEKNDEINIGKIDVSIFKSSFDIDYFREYNDSIKNGVFKGNYECFKDIKTYMSSAITKLPMEILFGDYKNINYNSPNDENILNCSLKISQKSSDGMVHFSIDLINAMYEKYGHLIKDDLSKIINENYIKNNDFDLFVKNIISQNLINNYIVDLVSFYTKDNNGYYDVVNKTTNELTLLKENYKKEQKITTKIDKNIIEISYKLGNEVYKFDNFSYGIIVGIKIS